MTIGYRTAEELGTVLFDILRNDFHRPVVNGKINVENIEEKICEGIYNKELEPMNKTDVDFVCKLLQELVDEYANL